MKHFKSYTMGKVVIMGRKTFASIGKPLPGRKSIVVSTSPVAGVVNAASIDSALSVEYCYPELVIIGGASLYEQTIDRADKLIITHIDKEFDADTFFPIIDLEKWKIENIVPSSDSNYNFQFIEYIRR
jgi:dihydrofolate reductase